MALRLGLGLGAGGGRALLDTDALSYFNRAGVPAGDITIPKYSNKNLLSDSTFALNTWSQYGVNLVFQNSIVDPFGNTGTVYKAVESAALTGHRTERPISGGAVPIGTTIRYSVYLKAGERTSVLLSDGGSTSSNISVNLTNGTVLSSQGVGLGTIITDVGNGWYRCSYTYTTANSIVYPNISPVIGGTNNYTGDGSSGFYVYGPQIELGSSTTSYVPTTTPAKGIDGTITVNPRQQIIDFIKGVKTLGLWNNFICWPLRSFQNSKTLLTARSLGGLGIYDATIANTSAGTAWRNDGLYMNASSAQTLTVGTLPFYLFNMGLVINRDALSTGGSIRFTQGGGRVPWLSADNLANISTSQFGGSTGLVAAGATNSFNEFAYVSGGQTSATTLSLFANGTFANSSSLPVIATSGTQSNQLIATGGGLSGAHTYSIIVGTNLQSDAIATSDFFELYKSTLGQGLSMR